MNSGKETDNKGVIIGAEQAVRTGMAKGRGKRNCGDKVNGTNGSEEGRAGLKTGLPLSPTDWRSVP